MTVAASQAPEAENERHFCMCITPDDVSGRAQRLLEGRRAALLNEFQWVKGNTIRIAFLSGSEVLRQRVQTAALTWLGPKMANLQFSFVKSGKSDIRIAFIQGDGSWSYLGTFCRQIAPDQPTMNYGWLTDESDDEAIKRVVLHEFGHALGLIHEHQNPNQAIEWNKPAVIADLSGPPNNWDLATIERNLFEKYDPAQVTSTRVDSRSIMMYPIPKSWTLNGFSADLNSGLSRRDRGFIRKAYPHD